MCLARRGGGSVSAGLPPCVPRAGETRGARWSPSLCAAQCGSEDGARRAAKPPRGDIRGTCRGMIRSSPSPAYRLESYWRGLRGGRAETSDLSPPRGVAGTPWLLQIWMELSLSPYQRHLHTCSCTRTGHDRSWSWSRYLLSVTDNLWSTWEMRDVSDSLRRWRATQAEQRPSRGHSGFAAVPSA